MAKTLKRTEEESKEGLPVVSNSGASSDKFQTEQQIQNTAEAEKVVTPKSGFDMKKVKTSGSTLKQEKIAKVVENPEYVGPGAQTSGVSLRSFRGVSGSSGGVLGAGNATPLAKESRSGTRYGKKQDRVATHLNFTPSEQVLVEYDEPPALAEAADETVGVNTTYKNEFARSQKTNGAVPGDLMYDRSVDMIFRDELYYSQGQVVRQTGVSANNDTPTSTAVKDANGIYQYADNNYTVKRGNYLNRSTSITIDSNGKVFSMGYETTEATPYVNQEIANKSSASRMIDVNYAELNRETMDSKAGDEKADIWTPLARAVKDPTLLAGYLRDLESMTGSEVAMNYAKAGLSMSFQLNRATKDGQETVRPAVEALNGMNTEALESSSYASQNLQGNVFTESEYGKGNASAIIAMYDTVGKYSNKSDLLLQPRSFRMHLQTADNNMDPLKVNKNFITYFKNRESFSTIDRDYDPMLPVCITDKASIIHPYNFNDLYSFVKRECVVNSDSSSTSRVIDLISSETVGNFSTLYVYYKLLTGVSAPTYSTGVITIPDSEVISFIFSESSTAPTGYTLLQSFGSAADIKISGKITSWYGSGDDVFPAGKGPYTYKYMDLRNNYVLTVKFPLLDGFRSYLDAGAGQLWKTKCSKNKKLFIPMISSTQFFSLWSFMLCAATPFIVTSRINSFRDVIYYEKNIGEYPFNQLLSISDFTGKSFSNFSYKGYDEPLETGIMEPITAMSWYLPEFFWNISNKDVYYSAAKSGASAGDDQIVLFSNNSGDSVTVYVYADEDRTATVETDPSALGDDIVYISGSGTANIIISTSSTAPEGCELIDSSFAVANNHSVILENKANYTLGISASAVLPWYFNQDQFIYHGAAVTNNDDADVFSMPCIRSGAKLSFLDNVYGLKAKDILLGLDRIVTPFYYDASGNQAVHYLATKGNNGVYKYGVITDGQPMFTFDQGISITQFLGMPRMLGWGLVAPCGLLTPSYSSRRAFSSDVLDATSYRIKYFTAAYPAGKTADTIGSFLNTNKNAEVNINRAANFSQVWHQAFADGATITYDYGMTFSIADMFDPNASTGSEAFVGGVSYFAPFVDDNTANPSTLTQFKVVSLQKGFWTRIQKLPFVISPFDAFNAIGEKPNNVDIYDIGYLFGLCGFRAVDYREEVYNREKQVVNQGRLFVSDPFIEDSPVFKGISGSGLVKTEGYKFSLN